MDANDLMVKGTWASVAMLMAYCKIYNIRHTKSQNLNDSRLILQLSSKTTARWGENHLSFGQMSNPSIEASCYVENGDVAGATPTGNAPTTSEWSTILLPTKVQLILEVWQYFFRNIPVPAQEELRYVCEYILD